MSDDRTTVIERFSEQVKTASWEVHEHAERSPFIRKLLAGQASIREYGELVAQHWFIYSALEEAAAAIAADPVARGFAVAELARVPALEDDLVALRGASWRDDIAPNSATTAYVERIRAVCPTWPGGFVAHHYVRYLGDLSGGQIIRRILQRTYGITDGAGISFYVFDRIGNGVTFKKQYRHLLDTAPWDADERERIIDEVIRAFELNTAVLEMLG